MEARAESSGVLAMLGHLLVVAGCFVLGAGVLYCAAGWRYGAVVAIWAVQWGLPLIGLGTGMARFGRRGTSVVAVGGGLGGLLLILMGEMSREYDSYFVAGGIGGVSIALGVASAVARRRAKAPRER